MLLSNHPLFHHFHLPRHSSPHTSCSPRGKKRTFNAPDEAIAEREFPLWSPGSRRKMLQTVTICASFAITCALSSKQMTLNDSSPNDSRDIKKLMSKIWHWGINYKHLMFVIYLFISPFIVGRRKRMNTLCKVMQPVFIGQHEHVCVWKHTQLLFMHNRMNRWCLELQPLVCYWETTGWMIREYSGISHSVNWKLWNSTWHKYNNATYSTSHNISFL